MWLFHKRLVLKCSPAQLVFGDNSLFGADNDHRAISGRSADVAFAVSAVQATDRSICTHYYRPMFPNKYCSTRSNSLLTVNKLLYE